MSKSTKKSKSPRIAAMRAPVAKPSSQEPASRKPTPDSKQSRVIAMLQSPDGVTIDAVMKATGWQQHSVRGFLAGVVRKKLKLKLGSTKGDGQRVYCVEQANGVKASGKSPKRRTA